MGNCYANRSMRSTDNFSFARKQQFDVVAHIKSHDLYPVKCLLEEGFPLDYRLSAFNDRTLLHIAAQNGSASICEMLLKRGAKVDSQDIGGLTPLFLSMQNCDEALLQLFSKFKADFNHTTKYNTRLTDYLPRLPIKQQNRILSLIQRYGFIETHDPRYEVFND
mmetsp:Transcript_10619/g.20527  ORF Transcript_10619/g.20527 Transcript_10619/m.20527 type:complete len:164 (-) Transcript_10619:1189-1680(-)